MKKQMVKAIYALTLSVLLTGTGLMEGSNNINAIAANTEQVNHNATVYTTNGMADFGRGNASISIKGRENQSLVGKKFRIYQLFHAENSKEGESIQYTFHKSYEKSLKTVVSKKIGKIESKVTEYDVIDYIQSLNSNVAEGAQNQQKLEGAYSSYRYFVEELRDQLLKDKVVADTVVVTQVKSNNSIVINGLDYGYYVTDEVSEVNGIHSASSLCMVNTANPKAAVNIKSDYPSVVKKIQEDDNRTEIGNTGWNDIADYEIGQTVPYKYESNIPNMNGYSSYYYAWHDNMDDALTFHKDSVSIRIYETSNPKSKCYTLKTNEFNVLEQLGENETFKVEIKDIKAIVDREFNHKNLSNENVYGQKVVLSYNATLNDKAAEDTGRPGFENDVRLEFSNDADGIGEGKTGFTPWDTVVCFTYKLNVLKVNNHNLQLDGAKFRLYSDENLENEVYVKKVTDEYHVINRDLTGVTKPKDAVEMVSDKNGNVIVCGLDSGTYYLKEIEAPTGYRPLLDPIVLKIIPTFTDERNNYIKGEGATDKTLKRLEVSAHLKEFLNGVFQESDEMLTTNIQDGSANITVINTVGKKLPETGSGVVMVIMGIGSALLISSMLYVRKKTSGKEN